MLSIQMQLQCGIMQLKVIFKPPYFAQFRLLTKFVDSKTKFELTNFVFMGIIKVTNNCGGAV